MEQQLTSTKSSREQWQSYVRDANPMEDMSGVVQRPVGILDIMDPEDAIKVLVKTIPEDKSERFDEIELEIETELNEFFGMSDSEAMKSMHELLMSHPEVIEHIESRDLSSVTTELKRVLPEFDVAFHLGLDFAINGGYFPVAMKERFEKALKNTPIKGVDSAVTKALNITAYYLNDTDEIGVVDRGSEITDDTYFEVLAHEFLHKLSGGTFRADENGNPYRYRAGFVTQKGKDSFIRTGWNEAATQHLALGILSGDFENINPDKRLDDSETYYGFRRIVGDVFEKSRGKLTVQALANAYCEETGPEGTFKDRKLFVKQVVDTYGYGAIRKIEKLMKHINDVGEGKKALKALCARVHPPEFDHEGNIVKKGWIDTDQLPSYTEIHGIPTEFKRLEKYETTMPNPFVDN